MSTEEHTLNNFKYKLAIAAIMKEEESYVEEWILYHLISGVDHFYIYDNGEDDEFKTILDKYIKKGIVTYIPLQGEDKQVTAYNHAISNYDKEAKYIALIDADEFLVPVHGEKLNNLVDSLFNKYTDYKYLYNKQPGGLGVNWRMYGTGNHKERPKGYVLENFLLRADDSWVENFHIKTIVNPRCVQKAIVHNCIYKKGYACISENGSEIPGPFFPDGKCEFIRINHYHFKSEEEFLKRIKRGWIDPDNEKKKKDALYYLSKSHIWNMVYDPIMLPYVEKIKEYLSNNVLEI